MTGMFKTDWLRQRSRFSLRGDVNGLVIVLAVLAALLMLPGPGCSMQAGAYLAKDAPVVSGVKPGV